MAMVVECESCRSSFRLNESLLKGSKAIRFRCPSCDGYIVVRNPEMHKIAPVPSPAPSTPPVSPERPAAPATHPEQEMAAVATLAPPDSCIEPEMPTVSSKPAPTVVGGEPEASAVGNKTAFSGEADPGAIPLEDLVPFVPEGEVRSDRDTVGGMGAVKRVATETRPTVFRIRALAIGVISFFAGLGILLLLSSGAYYIWGAIDPWVISPAKKPSLAGGANAASTQPKPIFDVLNLDAYISREAVAGNLFVINGTVKNVGNASSRGIGIQATLFGKDNQVLIKQAAIAGNYIDKFALPHMVRDSIEKHLAARDEAETWNHDLPPGNSLSFTVVFFDPPGMAESYEVLATSVEL